MNRPIYVSVDLEVTDTDPVKGSIMSVGLIASTGQQGQWIFPISPVHPVSEWVQENLAGLLSNCRETYRYSLRYVDQVKSIHYFLEDVRAKNLQAFDASMLRAAFGMPEVISRVELVFVGYCTGLDWSFLTHAFATCSYENPFHYEHIEISSLAIGRLGLPWGFTQVELEKRLGVQPNPAPHDALADAKHQMLLFKRLMEQPV